MNELLTLFSNNILPIFLAAGAGFLAAKYLHVTPRSVSQVAFYILSPCLTFYLLTTNHLTGSDASKMVGFTVLSVFIIGCLTALIGWLLKLERTLLVALVLTVMFGNAGNYGLSLNLFAFGPDAVAYASLYFVTVAILIYTVGVLIASLGKMALPKALVGLLKVPAIYAVILALLFNLYSLKLPLPIDRTVTLLSDAAIPVLMVLMGIQLYDVKISDHKALLGLSSGLRLIASPLIALALCLLIGLKGAPFQAAMLESAVPTAVIMTVLATEYDVQPSFVTSAVFVSTILSPITITPLLKFLGAG